MLHYFSYLPTELKIKIFLSIPYWQRKPILFETNTIVEYNDKEKYKIWKRRNELIIKHGSMITRMGDSPLDKLTISDKNPIWDIKKKDWKYCFKYGTSNRSTGYAYQNEIVLYNKEKNIYLIK